MAPKILVVLTSHSLIESINKPTGWFLPEFSHPYDILAPKAEIVVASPKGGVAPLDPASIEFSKSDDGAQNFYKTKSEVWEKTRPIKEFLGKADEYDALFYPGGHGPVFDLATDIESIQLIIQFLDAGKPVAAVCHGPAAFANVVGKDGNHVLKGKTVTGFTNAEEDIMQLSSAMPFLLEDALIKAGANYVKADEPWGEKVVTDGLIITGQNPASAAGVGKALATALGL
ncbi:unnamed protein product [Clonostachys byssicola]|uniref:D-lactate dehydratase n=1 Tax=Clonostachys byssicola TaxID=160290 RepID=A0A9N9UGA1_9HYPO|nr:unnamed protein product [Clonostachys byssicola]